MKWSAKNIQSGQLVASQTPSEDFKELQILSVEGEDWRLISLLDGMVMYVGNADGMAARLNLNAYVPITKVFGHGNDPENRMHLPLVRIKNLRGT